MPWWVMCHAQAPEHRGRWQLSVGDGASEQVDQPAMCVCAFRRAGQTTPRCGQCVEHGEWQLERVRTGQPWVVEEPEKRQVGQVSKLRGHRACPPSPSPARHQSTTHITRRRATSRRQTHTSELPSPLLLYAERVAQQTNVTRAASKGTLTHRSAGCWLEWPPSAPRVVRTRWVWRLVEVRTRRTHVPAQETPRASQHTRARTHARATYASLTRAHTSTPSQPAAPSTTQKQPSSKQPRTHRMCVRIRLQSVPRYTGQPYRSEGCDRELALSAARAVRTRWECGLKA
jgi:hypothetical protein